MKKLALTVAIVLVLGLTTFADPNQGGGLFQRGAVSEEMSYGTRDGNGSLINFPVHGSEENENAPLGSGLVWLVGLGAAYAIGKRRKDD